jgi:ABC-type branched-subunit amino acid transport system substrate-binding protein
MLSRRTTLPLLTAFPAAAFAAEEIKIGGILPMTGNAASYGEWMRNGMNIAVDEISKKWTDRKLVLIYEDSKSNPKTPSRR